MRNLLFEYFRPSAEEFKSLWDSATITFDASSLLNLHGYSDETKRELVKAYEKFSARIVLPFQFAYEYSVNRASVINKQISNYKKAIKDLEGLKQKHSSKKEQPFLNEKSQKSVDEIIKELTEGLSKTEKSMASDEDSDLILSIFEGKIVKKLKEVELEKIYEIGAERYKSKKPPGYLDAEKGEPQCYGDLVGWKQIIEFAKEKSTDMILVTDDIKSDWWHYEDTRLVGPRPELRREFRDETKKSIWLYDTEGFLRAAREFSDIAIENDAISEVAAALETKRDERQLRYEKLMIAAAAKHFLKPGKDDQKPISVSAKIARPDEEDFGEEDDVADDGDE